MNKKNDILLNVCNKIYKNESSSKGLININIFLDKLKSNGILEDDIRIENFLKIIKEYKKIDLTQKEFINAITENITIIEKILSNNFIICDFSNFCINLKQMYDECKNINDGELADYIPQLAKQDPNLFGLSICTINGQRYNIGDTNKAFCVQSCCKPINYCLCLEELGEEIVHKHVGREPSGQEFNALKLNKKGLPHNPLINSGAIMTCSLIKKDYEQSERFDYILEMWSKLAGGKKVGFNNSVYLSEKNHANRNFALAYFMNENKTFPEGTNLIDVLEFYFQCCSLNVTTEILSIVAATLANGGICPFTGNKILSKKTVRNCLSMMYSCGMYDYSGEFAFKIGLPAKSGVAGGIFVIIPNVMGICTYSPKLDSYGNSVRGVSFYKKLIKKYSFHNFDNLVNNGDHKIDPRKKNNCDKITQEEIIRLCSIGDLSALKCLNLNDINLEEGDYDKRTPLHLACSNGHLNIVKYLIENCGIKNINSKDRWNGTPLDDAIREKHKNIVSYLKNKISNT